MALLLTKGLDAVNHFFSIWGIVELLGEGEDRQIAERHSAAQNYLRVCDVLQLDEHWRKAAEMAFRIAEKYLEEESELTQDRGAQ